MTAHGEPRSHFEQMMANGDREAGCWEWPFARVAAGYGHFWLDGKTVDAHRLAFEREHGRAPVVARHSCDNPPCFNPAHIVDGTQGDNLDDAIGRGRWVCPDRRGTRNGRAKLNEEKVRQMLALLAAGSTHAAVAAQFGVSEPSVWQLANGRTWTHVERP